MACDSYDWNGVIILVAHTYESTNDEGCINVATLTLVITHSESVWDVVACDSYDWNGTTYTEGGSYTYESLMTRVVLMLLL